MLGTSIGIIITKHYHTPVCRWSDTRGQAILAHRQVPGAQPGACSLTSDNNAL